MAAPGTAKSSFLQKFQNKISVVGKDGSHTQFADPSVKTRPAPDFRENIDAQRPWKVPGASALAKPKGEAAPAGARNTHVSPKTSHVAQRQKHAHFNDDGYGGGGGGYHEASARQAHSSYHPERPGKGSYARREAHFEKPEDQLAYSKAPRPVEYVPYNERDYKAQYGNGYYELGKLGPDISPEELDEKRARMERIKEYAEAVRHENKQSVQNAPQKRVVPKPPSSRQKAIEFAKRVPKPKAKVVQQQHSASDEGDGSEDEGMTVLQQLAMRHQRDKELVNAIRKDLRIS